MTVRYCLFSMTGIVLWQGTVLSITKYDFLGVELCFPFCFLEYLQLLFNMQVYLSSLIGS